jgi:hypothetical protein
MFTTLAKSGLARSWPVQPQRVAPGLHRATLSSNTTWSNDNLPGFRHPAATGKRRSPTPALACHWVIRGGRLECCGHCKTDEAPSGGFDEREHPAAGRASERSSIQSRDLAQVG